MKNSLLSGLLGACTLFLAQAQTNFGPKLSISATDNNPYTIASGRIDSDTHTDIVVGSYAGDNEIAWFKNNGNGTFTKQPLVINSLSGIGGLKLVDLNNDTYLDLLAVGFNSNSLVWYPNDGNGNFNIAGEQIISNSISGASGLAVATIDAGSTPDIAVTSYSSNQTIWFSNNGSGSFSGPQTIDNTLTNPGVVNFDDIDNDGDMDALVLTGQYNSNNVIEIFRNNLVPSGSVSFTKDANSVGTGEDFLFNGNFVDMDGDANLDILVTELDITIGNGSLLWFEDNGSGFTRTEIATSLENPAVAQMHDLDEDGLKDLVVSSGAAGTGNDIVWFKNFGAGTFGSENVIDNTQSQAYVFTVADFDADGDKDIASCAYNQNTLSWFKNYRFTLSTDSESLEAIRPYPNPTQDHIFFKGLQASQAFVLYSVLGEKMLEGTVTPTQGINISQFNKGVYLLQLGNQNQTFKIIKH